MPVRRKAYDSSMVRTLRATLGRLCEVEHQLRRHQGTGSWSPVLISRLAWLREWGLVSAGTNAVDLREAVRRQLQEHRQRLASVMRSMAKERIAKFRAEIPTMWLTRPKVLYRWLATAPLPVVAGR